ncbi:nucleotidyltransferase domain-containing protein [Heliorestis convoluta]|uniref:Nucleotidyltransferase domain-containing protein n=1 Tax=Heliorestis convoluta TaxID=356322 RepID=A0A5Q2N210_9FIRM|nr:nucleotidyltransferase domain-containing protein [Heliorestis convoluta]QGG48857.1 nucleotidyltransferase domain-containing protein [Heliorestis convoluta]
MVDSNVREEIKKIVLQYAEQVNKEFKLKEIYLYGSYIKGNHTEDSDIDVAVVAENFTGDLVEDTFRLMKLRRKIDYRIEPHPFLVDDFHENNPEAKEVIKSGLKVV